MNKELNIGSIIKNALEYSEKVVSSEHILSNISALEVLSLSDETNILKIVTSSNDTFNLDESSWKQISSNNEDGLSTYVSTSNSSIQLLIDETVVGIC